MRKLRWVLLCFLFVSNMACAGELSTVKLTVINEQGKPISDAKVGMSFLLSHGGNSYDGYTDSKGRVSATRFGTFGTSIYVTKVGYYTSQKRVPRGNQNITFIMRPIKNQVAMIAKEEHILLPKKGKKYAYDFKHGDLVVPHGEGLTAHIYFEVNGERPSHHTYDLSFNISFPNQYDGLIKYDINDDVIHESGFKFPYLAPLKGYNNKITHTAKRWQEKKWQRLVPHREETYDDFMLGYIFRVNTKVDDQGNIISANYVRIDGEIIASIGAPIAIEPNPGLANINFTYYYNPKANERSMEIDYGKLSKLERKTYKNKVKKTK